MVSGLMICGCHGIKNAVSLVFVPLVESYKDTTDIFISCLSENQNLYSSANNLTPWWEDKSASSCLVHLQNQRFHDDKNFTLSSLFLSIYCILGIFLYTPFCNRNNCGPLLLK